MTINQSVNQSINQSIKFISASARLPASCTVFS